MNASYSGGTEDVTIKQGDNADERVEMRGTKKKRDEETLPDGKRGVFFTLLSVW